MRKLVVVILATLASFAGAVPTQHTVVKGEHLWFLAGHYYNNHFRWKVIYSANQDKIKDPHWIYPGQVFVIPDVPGPEIGEVGARPIEASAPVTKAPEPAPAPAPAPAPREPAPESLPDAGRRDDLSKDMPPAQAGQYPSMARLKAPKDWREDGVVVEFKGREILAAAGDSVNARLRKGVKASVGDRFAVYRRDAAEETDEDQKAQYLQRVGTAEISKDLGGSVYTLLVLKSGDSLQLNDLLRKEAP